MGLVTRTPVTTAHGTPSREIPGENFGKRGALVSVRDPCVGWRRDPALLCSTRWALPRLRELPEPLFVEQHNVPARFGSDQVLVGEARDGADSGFEGCAGEVGQVLA